MQETLVVHTDYTPKKAALRKLIQRIDTAGELIAGGARNTIKKVELDGKVFNVKKFKTPSFFQGLVYQFIRKSKARRSFEYAGRLLEFDIKTPFPIAFFERKGLGLKESYYISEHLEYDFDFRTLIHNPNWPNRNEILKQFALFTFQLHESGINFLDHSPGNTLIVESSPGVYDFYLIDLNRMRFETMDFANRMKNFRRLWLSKTMINVMAPVYAELRGATPDKTHELMAYYSRKFQKKVNSKKWRRRKRK